MPRSMKKLFAMMALCCLPLLMSCSISPELAENLTINPEALLDPSACMFEVDADAMRIEPPWGMGIIETIVTITVDSLAIFKQETYERLIENESYINSVVAALVLYIALYGVYFMFGMSELNQKEVFIRLVKIGIVATMISPGSWEFFNSTVFTLFEAGAKEFMGLVFSVGSQIGEYSAFADQHDPFKQFDNMLMDIFSPSFHFRILSFIFCPSGVGLIYIPITYVCIILFILMIGKGVTLYLLSLIAVAILIILAPIVFPMILFQQSKKVFDEWVQMIFSYTLQPIFIFAFLGMMGGIINNRFYGAFSGTSCWKSIWSVGVQFLAPGAPPGGTEGIAATAGFIMSIPMIALDFISLVLALIPGMPSFGFLVPPEGLECAGYLEVIATVILVFAMYKFFEQVTKYATEIAGTGASGEDLFGEAGEMFSLDQDFADLMAETIRGKGGKKGKDDKASRDDIKDKEDKEDKEARDEMDAKDAKGEKDEKDEKEQRDDIKEKGEKDDERQRLTEEENRRVAERLDANRQGLDSYNSMAYDANGATVNFNMSRGGLEQGREFQDRLRDEHGINAEMRAYDGNNVQIVISPEDMDRLRAGEDEVVEDRIDRAGGVGEDRAVPPGGGGAPEEGEGPQEVEGPEVPPQQLTPEEQAAAAEEARQEAEARIREEEDRRRDEETERIKEQLEAQAAAKEAAMAEWKEKEKAWEEEQEKLRPQREAAAKKAQEEEEAAAKEGGAAFDQAELNKAKEEEEKLRLYYKKKQEELEEARLRAEEEAAKWQELFDKSGGGGGGDNQ